MSAEDKVMLDDLNRKFSEFIKTQTQVNAATHEDLQTLIRGFYGDERNGVKGFIQRQNEDEKKFEALDSRLTQVEQKQYKQFVWGAGILVALEVFWNFIKEKFL